jgi:AbiJ N-terminal domain 3
MSGAADLAERIAETLRQRATNDQMTSVGLRAGVVIPAYEEGVSKRDRARQGIAGKTERKLGEIARLLGIQFSDYALEEAGLAVLEHGTAAITVITRRDVAKCFGDDLCGEQDVVEIVRKLFPIDTMGAEFFSSRSLSHNIEQHMIRNPGDWSHAAMPDPAIAPHPIRRRSILRAQLRSRDHVRAPATRPLTCRHACRPRFGVTPRRLVHRPDAGTTGRGRPDC